MRAQLIRSGMGVGGLRVFSMPLSMATSIVLARGLGVEGYGVYTYTLAIASLLALPAYAGLPPLLIREVAKYDQSRHLGLFTGITRRAHQVTVVLGLLLMLIVLCVAFWQAEWRDDDYWTLLLVAAILIPIIALLNVRGAVLQGLRKVVQAKIPELLVRPAAFLVAAIILMGSGYLTPLWAVIAHVAAVAITLAVVSILMARSVRGRHGAASYDDRRWGAALVPFSAIAGVSYLNTSFIIPLVGFLASDGEVAYFRIALSLALLVGLPLSIAEIVVHPHISRMYGTEAVDRIFRMISKAGRTALLASIPVALLFVSFGHELIHLLYGPAYTEVYLPLVVLIAGFGIVNLVGPSMQLLYATQYEKDALVISLFSLILIGGLSIALVPTHGALGAAFSYAIPKAGRAIVFRLWAHVRLKAQKNDLYA